MSVILSGAIRIGGVDYLPGATVAGSLSFEDELVNRGVAKWASLDPTIVIPQTTTYDKNGNVAFIGVDISGKATSGLGTVASPWMGWDTAITWIPGIQYAFPGGYYSYATPPVGWAQSNMQLIGTPNTILKYTGTTKATNFDGSVTPITEVIFGPFIIDAGGGTHGFFTNSVNRSQFNNVRVRNCTQYGFQNLFSVLNRFDNPQCNEPIGGSLARPNVHFELNTTGGSNYSSANTIINPMMEYNTKGTGINLIGGTVHTTTIGGSCESVGVGVNIGSPTDSLSSKNKFIGIDIEANLADIVVQGFGNSFDSIIALSYGMTINVTGQTGTFVYGEIITHSPSGKTAQVMLNSAGVVKAISLVNDTGWDVLVSGTITGGTSGAIATVSSVVPIPSTQLTASSKGTMLIGGQYGGRIQERGAGNNLIGIGYLNSLLDSYFNKFLQLQCWDLNAAVAYTTGLAKSQNTSNPVAITVPASSALWTNTTGYPLQVLSKGGTVTDIQIVRNGFNYSTGTTAGIFMLQPTDQIFWVYTVAPTAVYIQQ